MSIEYYTIQINPNTVNTITQWLTIQKNFPKPTKAKES
jgi:hypothetical protein